MPGVKRPAETTDAASRAARRATLALPALLLFLPAVPAAGSGTASATLLGRERPSAILAISPEWRRGFDEYQPSPADVEVVRRAPKGSQVTVYFGSWCGDSRVGVPHFLKILEMTRAPHLKARYVGVDRAKKEPAGLLEGVGLELVPTFVLTVHGREIGRIVETPATTLEHDLALLFQKAIDQAP